MIEFWRWYPGRHEVLLLRPTRRHWSVGVGVEHEIELNGATTIVRVGPVAVMWFRWRRAAYLRAWNAK